MQSHAAVALNVDLHIGQRIAERRQELGLTLHDVSSRAGLSQHQCQAYEQGTVRLNTTALYDISKVLHIQPSYFFNGLPAK